MQFLKRLLLLLTLLLLCLPFAAAEENLLYNASFEEINSQGMPVGWYTDAYVQEEGFTLWSVEADAQSGSQSAVVHNLGMNDARFAQVVAVEPETMYCLSGWIKADGISEVGRGANLSIYDVYSFSTSVYDTAGEWQYVELYGETGEDQEELIVYARVGGYSGESEGRAQFDNLQLRQVDALPASVEAADLWFRLPSFEQYDRGEQAAEVAGEASPFWPWLLVISAIYVLAAFQMLRWMQVDRHELQPESRQTPLFLLVGLLAAYLVRIFVALNVYGYQVDVSCFVAWGHTMAEVGPSMFYQTTSFCDYSPGYLYVMGLNSMLSNTLLGVLDASVVHKLIPIFCDVVMAWMLYRFALECRFGRNQAGMLGLIFAFMPPMILNSAGWCQIDSVLCLGLMLVAWLAIRRNWTVCLPVYVLCVLIKPQALMLGFLGLLAIILDVVQADRASGERRNKLLQLLWGTGFSLLLTLVIVLPFSLYQESGTWLFDLYKETLGSYPYVTVNAANFFYLLGANWFDIQLTCGVLPPLLFALLSAAWAGYLFLHQRQRRAGLAEAVMMLGFAAFYAAMAWMNVTWSTLGVVSMTMAFAVVLPMYARSGKLHHLPLCGGTLFLLLFVLGVKMHERYLFPALILLAMAYALHRDRRTFLLLVGTACTLFINEGIVLDNSIRLGSSMGHLNNDTLWLNNLVSAVNLTLALFSVPVCHSICVEAYPERLSETARPLLPVRRYEAPPCTVRHYRPDASLPWKRLDWILMLSVTIVYAIVTLTTLGSTKAPQNPWKSTTAEERVIIDLGEHYDDFRMLYFTQVSYQNFTLNTSEDQQNWSEDYPVHTDEGNCFRWRYLTSFWYDANGNVIQGSPTSLSGRYVCITADQIGLKLNEVIFRDAQGQRIDARVIASYGANELSPNYTDPAALLDEQDTLEGEPSWYNSTYFDEIYHARTAFEHANGTAPYETSHPPLGKVIMSWFVQLFGMTPFGWRFAGAMAGVLMLPAMYLLGKQLTKRTSLAFAAMTMMALDCMHFTQTRIATIDSYPVLFIIVSFFFMLRFMQREIVLEPIKKLLPDLALSGLFMGLAVSSKWIGAYAGIGLAVLYFWMCIRHIRFSRLAAEELKHAEDLSEEERLILEKRRDGAWKRIICLCLWCLLFFVAIPLTIYLLSYVPHFAYAYKENLSDFLRLVYNANFAEVYGMLDYHSQPGLGMDHPFYSPWYEWPLNQRPMYYASPSFVPEGWSYAIFCFGNPAVWTAGLFGIAFTAAMWFKRHRYRIGDSERLLHLNGSSWNVAPAFVLIGLMAQFLPWVLVPRGTYIYHYFASIPFLILGVILLLQWLFQRDKAAGRGVMAALLVLCLVLFIAYFPYASGVLTPTWWLDFMKQFLLIYY